MFLKISYKSSDFEAFMESLKKKGKDIHRIKLKCKSIY